MQRTDAKPSLFGGYVGSACGLLLLEWVVNVKVLFGVLFYNILDGMT
jgi:hypothetical protein